MIRRTIRQDDKNESYPNLKRVLRTGTGMALLIYIPGAIYKVELDNSHPLAFGYGRFFLFFTKTITAIFMGVAKGWMECQGL